MREGALERATLRGYRAQEFWLHRDGMSNEALQQMLHARGIQGLLISRAGRRSVAALRWEYFASVSLSVPQPALTITRSAATIIFPVCSRREWPPARLRRPGLVLRAPTSFGFRALAGRIPDLAAAPADLTLTEPL